MIPQPWNGVVGAIIGLVFGYGVVVPLVKWWRK